MDSLEAFIMLQFMSEMGNYCRLLTMEIEDYLPMPGMACDEFVYGDWDGLLPYEGKSLAQGVAMRGRIS